MDQRSDVGEFLRSRRAKVTPDQAGIISGGRRRVPGLRREEVATLADHLAALRERTTVVPAVNQIEVHPYFSQPAVQQANAELGIVTQAWSPMGGITSYRGTGTSTFDDPTIGEVAAAHDKTAAQVMLRWHLQQGRSAIPKSVKPERIAANFDVFDFDLTAAELQRIDALDTGVRGGPEPEAVTREAFHRDIPEA